MTDAKPLPLKDEWRWNTQERQRQQMLKRFVELSSQVEGLRTVISQQVNDVIGLVEALEERLAEQDEKIEKIRAFLKEKFLDNGGDE